MAVDFSVNVNTQKAIAALDALSKKTQELEEKFGNAFGSINNYALGLQAVLVGLGTATAAFADELADVAAANETTIASVLGLGSALQGAGGNADSVGRLMQTLTNNVEQANSGNLKLVSTFGKLGISIKDLGTLSQDSIRNNMIKALADMEDPIQRNALAMDMFGKAAVGVDWKAVSADLEENAGKYSQYEDALGTAGDAFDNLGKLVKDLKVAFAQTFEPVFKYIANLKISVEDLITPLKLAAAAMVALTSAAVIGGLVKVIGLMRTLSTVVSKNPLVTIAAALISAGSAAATYLGISKAMEDAQEEVNIKVDEQVPKVKQATRSQEGLNDVIEKQRQSLTKIGDQLDLNFKKNLDALRRQNDSVKLSADEKELREAIAKIEDDVASRKLALQDEFNKKSKQEQDLSRQTYEGELRRIDELGAAQRRATEENIKNLQLYQQSMRDLNSMSSIFTDTTVKNFEMIAKHINDQTGLHQRIEQEAKLNQLSKLRAELSNSVARLSEEDRASASRAIAEVTTGVDLLGKGYQEINNSIAEGIRLKVADGQITKEAGDRILASLSMQGAYLAKSSEVLSNNNKRIVDEQRTFQYGWEQAFKEYAENASNAANIAKNIFSKTMQGMEDLIVNFAKTGKFEWKNFVASLAEELLRSQVRQLMANLFNIQSSAGNTGSSILGNIFGGFFADGGNLAPGKIGVVGERGPELISGPATITPMTGSTNVTYNINAVDAMSFKQMVARDPSFIHAVAMQGGRGLPGRYS